MNRRRFLRAFAGASAAAFLPLRTQAEAQHDGDLEVIDLDLEGDRRLARRARLLVPKNVARGAKVPVLVLLHGLGETVNAQLGLRAWTDFYGLTTAYERLRRPPVNRTLSRARYLDDQRRDRINEALARRPFRDLALVCPFTANVHRLPPRERSLDRYADWIADVLLPAVRDRAPVGSTAAATGLDGCSLGGYIALEVFLRRPSVFGTFGMVQSAIGAERGPAYAERIAAAFERTGPRPVHLETSSLDPYRRANERLSRELTARGIDHDLDVIPGPHDQPWLREVGTLEMLRWHEARLAR